MKRGELKRKTPLAPGSSTLKRTQLARGTTPMKRPDKPIAAVGARGKRMRQGKVAATVEESAWMSAASQFCIVCYLQHSIKAQAEIHHLKAGDRRRGHLFTIGLCQPHHRGGASEGPFISRHPWLKRFEAAYGTEDELLATLRALLGQ